MKAPLILCFCSGSKEGILWAYIKIIIFRECGLQVRPVEVHSKRFIDFGKGVQTGLWLINFVADSIIPTYVVLNHD